MTVSCLSNVTLPAAQNARPAPITRAIELLVQGQPDAWTLQPSARVPGLTYTKRPMSWQASV